MKFLRILMFIGFAGLLSVQVQGQSLTKAQKKKLKKEIKSYKKNPVTYKQMKERNKNDIIERDETIEALTAQLDAQNSANRAMKDSLNLLSSRYKSLMAKYQSVGAVPTGTVYAVQIGYFELLELESFNSNIKMIKAEVVEGAKRYVIGYFNDVNSAVQFGEDIKTIGINDAFVSQYIDGNRNMEFDALNVK